MINQATSENPNQSRAESLIEPLFVTVATAKRLTGLGATLIYEMIACGALESFKVGNRRLIKYESLRKLASTASQAA